MDPCAVHLPNGVGSARSVCLYLSLPEPIRKKGLVLNGKKFGDANEPHQAGLYEGLFVQHAVKGFA